MAPGIDKGIDVPATSGTAMPRSSGTEQHLRGEHSARPRGARRGLWRPGRCLSMPTSHASARIFSDSPTSRGGEQEHRNRDHHHHRPFQAEHLPVWYQSRHADREVEPKGHGGAMAHRARRRRLLGRRGSRLNVTGDDVEWVGAENGTTLSPEQAREAALALLARHPGRWSTETQGCHQETPGRAASAPPSPVRPCR